MVHRECAKFLKRMAREQKRKSPLPTQKKAKAMRVTMLAAFVAGSVLWNGNALADTAPYNLSGMMVYNHCKANTVSCQDFLVTMDSAIAALQRLGLLQRIICPPENATLGQDRLIFIRFAEAYPEALHRNAADVYLAAEIGAFPCRTGTGG
jgi:hypothetical protein